MLFILYIIQRYSAVVGGFYLEKNGREMSLVPIEVKIFAKHIQNPPNPFWEYLFRAVLTFEGLIKNELNLVYYSSFSHVHIIWI